MRFLRKGTLVLLALGLSVQVSVADVYQNGGSNYNGQQVNSYTNSGAEQYRRVMRTSRSGNIYNEAPPVVPKAVSGSSGNLKVPSSVSFKESPCPDLPDRIVNYGGTKLNLSEILEKHAKANNLDPLLLEEVIRQESNFQVSVSSYVGAQGLMQLMPGTAAMLGVRDPNDPDDNVRGGSRYLAEQLTTFGRLDYALAAYNAGPGAVSSYGGVPPYAETQNYVARIVSAYNNRVQQERAKSKSSKKDEN